MQRFVFKAETPDYDTFIMNATLESDLDSYECEIQQRRTGYETFR